MSIPKLVLPKNRLELDSSAKKLHAIRDKVATSVYLIPQESLRKLVDFRNGQVAAGGAEGPYTVDLIVFHSWGLGTKLGTLVDLSVELIVDLLDSAGKNKESQAKPEKRSFTMGFSYTTPVIVLLPGSGEDQKNKMREYINTGFRAISLESVTSEEIVLQGNFVEETQA